MSQLELAPGLLVDVARLSRFLATCVPDAGAVSRIELLAGGSSNLTLLVVHGDERTVLRRRPIGRIPDQAHDMRREHEVLRMLSPNFDQVPAPFGYCEDETILGAPFYAMGFVDGVVVQAAADVLPFPGEARRSACVDIVRVLAELHAVPLSSFPTYQPGRSRNVMDRHLQRWHERWTGRPHRILPEVDRIAGALRRSLPASDEITFVHGDYRIGNIVIDLAVTDRPVRAVLDWELASFGHPLTDLAHLLAYWEGTGEVTSHRAQLIARDASLPGAVELATLYSSFSGRSIEHLPVLLAFEHWRAAVIKEAIYQRRVDVGAPDEEIDDDRQGVDSHLLEAATRLDDVLDATPGHTAQ
jgi:aminoglycoside phosphotransferase (APT) family kinase protein